MENSKTVKNRAPTPQNVHIHEETGKLRKAFLCQANPIRFLPKIRHRKRPGINNCEGQTNSFTYCSKTYLTRHRKSKHRCRKLALSCFRFRRHIDNHRTSTRLRLVRRMSARFRLAQVTTYHTHLPTVSVTSFSTQQCFELSMIIMKSLLRKQELAGTNSPVRIDWDTVICARVCV